jgi:hypothetical protein
MLPTIWGVVHSGRIEVAEGVELAEGSKVLVTLLSETDRDFWTAASERCLAEVWDNTEDDVYAQLIEK